MFEWDTLPSEDGEKNKLNPILVGGMSPTWKLSPHLLLPEEMHLISPAPSLILSSWPSFSNSQSADMTVRKSGICKDSCILMPGKERFSRSLKSLNCFSFPCGTTELNVWREVGGRRGTHL